jgi:hypothetical protein
MNDEDAIAPETVAQAEDVSPAPETTTDAPADEPESAASETEGDDGPSDDEGKRKRNRHSPDKRIAQLTRQKHEALAAAERWKKEAQSLRAAPMPREDQFTSYDEFEAAKAEWQGDRAYARTAERQAEEARRQAEAVEQASRAEAIQAYRESVAAFKAVAPDYDQVALTAPIEDHVAQAVMEMDDGAPIAYALGQNHALARRISAMPPRQMLIELGKLAATLTAPKKNVVSKAPPPISPATGTGGTTTPDLGKMTMAEYRAHRMRSMS